MGKILFLETVYGKTKRGVLMKDLWYGSCVAKRIADVIKREGTHTVVELKSPYPRDANKAINEEKPDLVWWVGHGSKTATTLERVQLWISTAHNTKILDGTVAEAESCLTGAVLGKHLTEKENCTTYVGYDELYWLKWCADYYHYNCACQGRNPWRIREELWKKMVESTHESTLYFVLGMSRGMTTGEANEFSKDRFDHWIEYFRGRGVEARDVEEGAVLKTMEWILEHDKNCQVLHGDPNYKLPVAPAIPVEAVLSSAGIVVGMLTGTILAYHEEIEKFLSS